MKEWVSIPFQKTLYAMHVNITDDIYRLIMQLPMITLNYKDNKFYYSYSIGSSTSLASNACFLSMQVPHFPQAFSPPW